MYLLFEASHQPNGAEKVMWHLSHYVLKDSSFYFGYSLSHIHSLIFSLSLPSALPTSSLYNVFFLPSFQEAHWDRAWSDKLKPPGNIQWGTETGQPVGIDMDSSATDKPWIDRSMTASGRPHERLNQTTELSNYFQALVRCDKSLGFKLPGLGIICYVSLESWCIELQAWKLTQNGHSQIAHFLFLFLLCDMALTCLFPMI